jgi:hypothetical protein
MTTTGIITRTVSNITRMNNTPNGNPRFVITLIGDDGTEGTYRTKPDAMDNYKVHDGMIGQRLTAHVDSYYGKPTIFKIYWNPECCVFASVQD